MALFTKADLARVTIRKALHESSEMVLAKASREFSESKIYDIFITHSYSDADEILRLKQIIEEMNFTTYVDWIQDAQLDRTKVNKETADLLRYRMKQCKSLFFVTSVNSPGSRWMPWELGYFDGLKQRVAILPILESSTGTDEYKEQEYLGLYPYVIKDGVQGSSTLRIHESRDKYVSFKSWKDGGEPTNDRYKESREEINKIAFPEKR